MVSPGLVSRIIRPNFASTYVTTSRRASSNVRRLFELRIKCFSNSPGTSASDLRAGSRHPACSSASSRSATRKTPIARCLLDLPGEHRPGQMGVRKRLRFLPPVAGSYRFCNRRQAHKGFFRDLATMSLASWLVRAIFAVCICCSANSRFCKPRSTFVFVGRNSRSIASRVIISVPCSAGTTPASSRTPSAKIIIIWRSKKKTTSHRFLRHIQELVFL